tara:strand:+ start:103 stop:234 length:132 start_codon:yes stop_codon:yes gene_type:complete
MAKTVDEKGKVTSTLWERMENIKKDTKKRTQEKNEQIRKLLDY